MKARAARNSSQENKPTVKDLQSKFVKKKTIGSQKMSNMFEDTRLKEELTSLRKQFFEAIGTALTSFQQINHWKGLVYAYKLVAEVIQD